MKPKRKMFLGRAKLNFRFAKSFVMGLFHPDFLNIASACSQCHRLFIFSVEKPKTLLAEDLQDI